MLVQKTRTSTSTSETEALLSASPRRLSDADDESKPTTAGDWGRQSATFGWVTDAGALVMLIAPPLMTGWFLNSCTQHQCNIAAMPTALFQILRTSSLQATRYHRLLSLLYSWTPSLTFEAAAIWIAWLTFQATLYVVVPGKFSYGQRTPAGHLLPYHVNGLDCYVISHVCFGLGAYWGLWKASIVADNWSGLFVMANIGGYALTIFCYFKAYVFPTHEEDRKFTGSVWYDLLMGIEFNPRIGKMFDFKLFFNGRPGIIAWTLITSSFAAAQAGKIGYVTNSMLLVLALHTLYVVDFFWNEDWYLRTIDIAHDHMGFYLAWGDLVWLPFMYTLQGQYLYHNPKDLPLPAVVGIAATGALGYYIFRATNHQKDLVRALGGEVEIWGKKAQFITATYVTADGVCHTSLLLCSGWWGLAHQINYFGDILISLAMCMCCGVSDHALFGYFYVVWMLVLLNHRLIRSEHRCRAKYGKYWDEYCKRVPYKMVPWIY